MNDKSIVINHPNFCYKMKDIRRQETASQTTTPYDSTMITNKHPFWITNGTKIVYDNNDDQYNEENVKQYNENHNIAITNK